MYPLYFTIRKNHCDQTLLVLQIVDKEQDKYLTGIQHNTLSYSEIIMKPITKREAELLEVFGVVIVDSIEDMFLELSARGVDIYDSPNRPH